jgi:hypothetical protein
VRRFIGRLFLESREFGSEPSREAKDIWRSFRRRFSDSMRMILAFFKGTKRGRTMKKSFYDRSISFSVLR